MWIYKAQQIHKSAQGVVQNKLTLHYLQLNLQINYLIHKYNSYTIKWNNHPDPTKW